MSAYTWKHMLHHLLRLEQLPMHTIQSIGRWYVQKRALRAPIIPWDSLGNMKHMCNQHRKTPKVVQQDSHNKRAAVHQVLIHGNSVHNCEIINGGCGSIGGVPAYAARCCDGNIVTNRGATSCSFTRQSGFVGVRLEARVPRVISQLIKRLPVGSFMHRPSSAAPLTTALQQMAL